MRELAFLVDSILSLVVGVFLLRLLFQLNRTDFRNPFVQTIVRLTNPVVMPLRRLLPPIGRVDTASVVALVLAQLVRTAADFLLSGGGRPAVEVLLLIVLVKLVDLTLLLYLCALIGYVVLSWVAPDGYSPAGRVLADLVEPLLRPLRRALPHMGGMDWSPMVASLLLIVLRMVLNDRIVPFLFRNM